MEEKIKEIIIEEVGQAFNEFIFYARKLDKRLPLGAIESAIRNGDITVDEIVAEFKSCIESITKSST